MISKGCTAKNTFTVPFERDDVEVLYITYQQKDETVLEKTLEDCTFGDGEIYINISQEDSLKFESSIVVRIQIRARLKNNTTIKSNIVTTDVDRVLKDGVI